MMTASHFGLSAQRMYSHCQVDAACKGPLMGTAYIRSCTCAVTLRNFTVRARYQRTVVPTPDGGTIGLDWFRCQEACQRLPDTAPILLVLHSITGQGSLPNCASSQLRVCNTLLLHAFASCSR